MARTRRRGNGDRGLFIGDPRCVRWYTLVGEPMASSASGHGHEGHGGHRNLRSWRRRQRSVNVNDALYDGVQRARVCARRRSCWRRLPRTRSCCAQRPRAGERRRLARYSGHAGGDLSMRTEGAIEPCAGNATLWETNSARRVAPSVSFGRWRGGCAGGPRGTRRRPCRPGAGLRGSGRGRCG